MSRFLKLVRIQNGSWQALPSDIDDHSPLTLTRNKNAPIDPFSLLNALANLLSPDGGINSCEEVPRLSRHGLHLNLEYLERRFKLQRVFC